MKLKPENPNALVRRIVSRPLVIYGMGYTGRLIAKWCDDNFIEYTFSDSSADKRALYTGRDTVAPELLAKKYRDANIVIASINYYKEIKNRLNQMGFDDSRLLSYLLFWPKVVPWEELEEHANWDEVRERARIFAGWIDGTAESVIDYSAERNFLKEFLPPGVLYYEPDYIRIKGDRLFADFSVDFDVTADVSSCIAVLMSFENPESVLRHICKSTRKSIVLSYVTLDKLPEATLRRSINYVNDFTEAQIIGALGEEGFTLKKKAADPFDEVHTVYLFEK